MRFRTVLASLENASGAQTGAVTLTHLKEVTIGRVAKVSNFRRNQQRLKSQLQDLIYMPKGSAARLQPSSPVSMPMELASPVDGRRLSYSQAASSPGGSHMKSLGRVLATRPVQTRTLQSLMKPSPLSFVGAGQGRGANAPTSPPCPSQQPSQPPPTVTETLPATAEKKPAKGRKAPPKGERAATQGQRTTGNVSAAACAASDATAAQQAVDCAQMTVQPHSANSAHGAAVQPTGDSQDTANTRQEIAGLTELVGQQAMALAEQAMEITALKATVANLSATVANLQQAQRTGSGTAIQAAQAVHTLRRTVECLQGEATRTQQLEQQVSHVQRRQQQLTELQHLEGCQRSVVLKTPQELPHERAQRAKAAGEMLSMLLNQPVTVLRAQELSNGSPGGRRHVYKLLLPSSEARDAVMRIKAARLRGTDHTIDVCLTPQQTARKQGLLKVAKKASAAGQRVKWRYDRLFIDGVECRSEGGLPGVDTQQGSATRSSGAATAGPAPVPTQDEPEEGEWQQVPPGKRKQRQQRQRQQQQQRQQPSTASTAPNNSSPARLPARKVAQSPSVDRKGGSAAGSLSSRPAAMTVRSGQKSGNNNQPSLPAAKPSQRIAGKANQGRARGKENAAPAGTNNNAAPAEHSKLPSPPNTGAGQAQLCSSPQRRQQRSPSPTSSHHRA